MSRVRFPKSDQFPPTACEQKAKIGSAPVWFLFSTLFSPTQLGQNGSSLYPDSLFLQTIGELIQILGTPRHSRALTQYRPIRICKKNLNAIVGQSRRVYKKKKKRFRFCKDRLPLKYRRPPSPSNGSLHGDTLNLQTRLSTPILSKLTALIGQCCRHFI